MEPTVIDADLLRRSLNQPEAFAVVYERHVGSVSTYLLRRVGAGVAEDLTAEVFVRAFRGASGLWRSARYGVAVAARDR